MDFLKNLGNENVNSSGQGQSTGQPQQTSDGGGFMGKLNSMAGGGASGEKNEDYLDKGIDMFQEKVLKQGPQNNESAVEQAKDEQVSDFIRTKYKSTTGKDFPIADKPTEF